jgi:hypothetical protein
MRTLEKDILLICKGWCSAKYNDILDAFNAYYHREYGCEDIIMDKRFAFELFLKPTIIEMSKHYPSIIKCLFERTYREDSMFEPDYSMDFYNVMYDRCISSLCQMKSRDKVDLSDYREMLNQIGNMPNRINETII